MSGTGKGGSSTCSEDEGRIEEEKRRKRMISNREAARRSRMKKQKLVADVTAEIGRLEAANSEIAVQIDEMSERYAVVAGQNSVLRAQELELGERLKCLNEVINQTSENADMEVGIRDDNDGDVTGCLLKRPWQIRFPILPIHAASSGLFKF
ncbi:unnamed protein product [Cuscuta europaea]|uniref:BZIP domain-containing protein n=1 Tax=Cuscuta europaea TaxID=41803 RepID=A0A9P0ZNU1_CUSEU|nr:unnamed protein product [Cuscuta europaea]